MLPLRTGTTLHLDGGSPKAAPLHVLRCRKLPPLPTSRCIMIMLGELGEVTVSAHSPTWACACPWPCCRLCPVCCADAFWGIVDPVLPLFQDLLLSTFNTLQAIGTTHLCPAECGVPALVLVFWVFLELLVFLLGIFLDGKSRAGVNWRMGLYAPPHLEIYPCSPALLFSMPQSLVHPHPQCVNGEREPKTKSGRAPALSLRDKGDSARATSYGPQS